MSAFLEWINLPPYIWITTLTIVVLVFAIMNWPKFRSIIRARNCKVEVQWNKISPNRVGGLVVVKIQPFLSPTSISPSRDFLNTETVQDLIRDMSVTAFVDEEKIDLTKELDQEHQEIHATFPVNKSGLYSIHINYCGFNVKGSPFMAVMEADIMDLEMSFVAVRNPVIIVQNKQFRIDVIPLDKFGNRCLTTLDTMQRLKFEAMRCDYTRHDNQNANDDINSNADFKISTGIRRVNGQEPDLNPLYTIQGKCSRVGRYMCNIFIGDYRLVLPTPTIEMLSISVDEVEMAQEKCDGPCKFNAQAILTNIPPPDFNNAFEDESECVGVWDVSLELTTKFIFLSRRIHNGPMDRRLDTWRVGNHVQVEIVSIQDHPQPDTHILKISNTISKSSKELVMNGSDTRVFLLMFHEYLALQRKETHIRSSANTRLSLDVENLKLKQDKLFRGIRESFALTFRKFKTLTVTRADIVNTTLEATESFTRYDWGMPFIVSFRNEPMNRTGTTWLDWVDDLSKEFFPSSAHGMFLAKNFTIAHRTRTGLLHPNPNSHKRWKLKHYELAGKVIAKCVIENAIDPDAQQHCFDARFSRTIFAIMLGIMPTYKHMQLDDPDYFRSTFDIVLNNDVADMQLKFSIREVDEMGNVKIFELVKDGSDIAVTNENKISYLNSLAKYDLFLKKTPQEIEAFVSGINFLIPTRLMMMFDENELELMLCGSSSLNLGNLIQHHHILSPNWNANFNKVKTWLGTALKEMDTLDLGRFFQFISGSSRLPNEGFVALQPSISLSALFGQSPTANKAECHLTVTDHKTYDDFLSTLLTAIRKNEFD